MTKDSLNALNLRYNYLNLLGKVESSADGSALASYKWLADGTKAGATTGDGAFGLEYLGSLVYKRNANNELELESTAFGGGRITVADTGSGLSYIPNYFIADHLSSTRVVVKPTIDGIEVVERNNFLPFGKKWEQLGSVITDNRFRYSGKEEQHLFSLPYNDHGARMYNPRTGQWNGLDKLMHLYYSWTPYVYVGNNPIRRVDSDGNKWRPAANSSPEFIKKLGKTLKYMNKKGTDGILAQIEAREETVYIEDGQVINHFDPVSMTIFWVPDMGAITDEENDIRVSPATILNHEADHALRELTDPEGKKVDKATPDAEYMNKEERRVVTGSEQETAKKHGEIKDGQVTRTNHRGRGYTTKKPTSTRPAKEPRVKKNKKEGDTFFNYSEDIE